MLRTLTVIDDFYPNPAAIRRIADEKNYVVPEESISWCSDGGYIPPTFKNILRKRAGLVLDYMRPIKGVPFDNGCFYLAFSQGYKKEKPWVHWDEPFSQYICLVYLSENVPVNCGISFYRHKKTGAEFGPSEKMSQSVGLSKQSFKDLLTRDGPYLKRFEEVDRVGHKYNRAIIYPASRLHAATAHFGRNLKDGRIFQAFIFSAK